MAINNDQELLQRLKEMKSKTTAAPVVETQPLVTTTFKDEKAGENEVLYSKVFGKSHSGREYAVPKYDDDQWPEWAREYIPDVLTGYVFPAEQTESLVAGLFKLNCRAQLLHGPKGSGKSSLTEQICAVLRIPFFRVNMSMDAESGRVFGNVDVQEGSMGWVKGAAEMAATCNDGAILQIDEASACPAGISLSMQWMLEKNGKIFLADKPMNETKYGKRQIIPGPNFRVVLTDNTQLQGDTTGNYSGTMVQNEAFIDRISQAIHIGYMDPAHEVKVIMAHVADVPKNLAQTMVTTANLIRGSYDSGKMQYTMSPRGLIEWAQHAVFWGDTARAYKSTFYAKLIPEDKKIADEHFRNATGLTL